MKTTVVTRVWYRDEIPKLRLELMQKYFIKSFAEQTDNDFNIDVICNENTVSQLIELDWMGLHVTYYPFNETPKKFRETDNPYLIEMDYVDVNGKAYKPYSEIQIRVDCDDWVRKDFIKRVKNEFKHKKDSLVSFYPTKHNHVTGERYFGGGKYSRKRPSMFIAIYQNKPKIGIYKDMHGRMAKYFERSHFIKEFGLCNLVVHSQNALTKP